MDAGIRVVAENTATKIMFEISRGDGKGLREIVRDEIMATLRRIADAQGWDTWPTHAPK